jgi:4-hydroxybenzoate polyprenyltransferase
MRTVNPLIALLRPHQWLKNLFVFMPLFFSGQITDENRLWPVCIMFLAFCLASSGVYCFNDVFDVASDRQHPQKCKRPIASGALSKTAGYAMMVLCWLLATGCLVAGGLLTEERGLKLVGLLAAYVVLNVLYCVWLKQICIVDVFIIATGFVLRIVAGGLAAHVELSHWLVLMTFLLALFLAFAKRRDDVAIFEASGTAARKSINHYNLAFINQTIGILASITMVCYIMYTVSPEVMERLHSSRVYMTSVFVLAGIIRYMQVTIVDVRSGSPTKVLLHDRFLQACIVGWLMTFGWIIYAS